MAHKGKAAVHTGNSRKEFCFFTMAILVVERGKIVWEILVVPRRKKGKLLTAVHNENWNTAELRVVQRGKVAVCVGNCCGAKGENCCTQAMWCKGGNCVMRWKFLWCEGGKLLRTGRTRGETVVSRWQRGNVLVTLGESLWCKGGKLRCTGGILVVQKDCDVQENVFSSGVAMLNKS